MSRTVARLLSTHRLRRARPAAAGLRRCVPVALAAAVIGGCGSEGIDLPEDATAQERQGAEVFYDRCSACHTLNVVGTEGSAVNANQREYKDGPNFNARPQTVDQVLYAIRNGGFSSGPMPQNIAVGEDADAVAAFVAKYAGSEAAQQTAP